MKERPLEEERRKIDQIDRQIIALLQTRLDVVRQIGRYKQRKGRPILDSAREREKLEALSSLCAEEKNGYVTDILKEIMAQSRQFQADHALGYGLLGRTLGHSHSPRIQTMLGGYDYGLFEREPEMLDSFFAETGWKGISVTMPYKREVMKYCDEISDKALACNSVNTIVRRQDGDTVRTFGDNTDYDGFRYVVEESGIDVKGKKTLVLGSGGVSGTVCQLMQDLGADPVIIISRTGENNYENLNMHADAGILVNTTPVGMFPHAGEAAVDIRRLPKLEAVYDLIYNPLRTRLMLDAEEEGIPAFGGLAMLVAQAARAVTIFGYPLRMTVEEACRILKQDLENIVLIGMPGAGKTSVGQALAQKMGREFLDLDDVIARQEGRTPEGIIREDGETEFRRIETEALRGIVREGSAGSGPKVIATGGGIVEREENRNLLRENGRVVWLKRPLDELPLGGRPISQREGLEAIYERRAGKYSSWSDLQVDCIGVEETAQAIGEMI